MAEGQPKLIRVMAGILLMAAIVLVGFGLITRYAGSWGVPYFSFTTERGSPCTNNLTGYTCTPLTLADIEYFADLDLPDDTMIMSSSYVATHDYRLDARMEVPKPSAATAGKALTEAFGGCQANRAAPQDTSGLTKVCVLANDDAITGSGEPASRLWLVVTGLRKDGTRTITLTIKSR